MFFSISKSADYNFPHRVTLGQLWLNFDNGWTLEEDSLKLQLSKGYNDSGTPLVPKLVPTETGNFCVINFSNNVIDICGNLNRSFPIYYDNERISNLYVTDSVVWSNNSVSIKQDFSFDLTVFNPINGIKLNKLSESEVIDGVTDILDKSVSAFVCSNTLPLKVFLSGGVDSMLVYSFVKKYTADYELVQCEHMDFDEFVCKNRTRLKKSFWGYAQIHHWKSPCVLTSGTMGDEYMLRSPAIATMFLMHHGINLLDLLAKENCLHKDYYLREKNLSIIKQTLDSKAVQDLVKDRAKLFSHLYKINLNDWQHWHLGNTLTYTPLRNLEIFKLMLTLPVDSAVGQILDSTVSKQIIKNNYPHLLQYLSNEKNVETLENMWHYYRHFETSGQ